MNMNEELQNRDISIAPLIHCIRSVRDILDSDLARLYEVPTKPPSWRSLPALGFHRTRHIAGGQHSEQSTRRRITLAKPHYTRTELFGVTRTVNRLFHMPAMFLFRQGGTLTLAIIPRRDDEVQLATSRKR